jgi:hypothetical protein
MVSFRAIARLALLAPLVMGAGCSSTTSQRCTWCDAGKSDLPGALPDPDTTPDARSEAEIVDQALALDNAASEATVDGSEAPQADAPARDTAKPSLVPDGGVVLMSDFKDGTVDGWRTADWTDAGTQDPDWSVFPGDTGYIYSEGVLDKTEWHISFTESAPVGDQIVEARMRIVEFYDTTPSFVAALFVRYDPHSDSGYFVALRGDGSVIIRKRVRGTNASWASGVDAGIVPGDWHTVRLEVLGNTVNAFLDGDQVYSVVDSDPLAEGIAALGSYGATIEVDRIFMAKP